MICMVCHKPATFMHTVFKGMSPVKVALCPECTTKTGAEQHVEAMKTAPDKNAKHAAAEALLKAVGK
jgi:protein-arginine kinase activator protein McsA